jgi:ketosteroid isomerase-like protein
MSTGKAVQDVVALERAVLDRWCKGDPHGYSENAAEDVTYCDHLTEAMRRGRAELNAHLSGYEGKVDVPRYEIENHQVTVSGDVALSVFNWNTFSPEGQLTSRWNATEAFRLADGRWRYVHVHWARVKEGQ